MLDVIIDTEIGTQKIPIPQQVASRKYVRRRQQHQHLTTSEPNHNPRGESSSGPGISDLGFVYSSGYPSGSPSDNPIEDPSTVTIIKASRVPSKTPTKYPYHVPKELPSANAINFLIEYSSGYTTCAPSTMSTDKNRSKFEIKVKLRPRWPQAREPWGTSKFANKSNTFHPLYHIIFFLKEKSHRDAPMSESDNIPHRGTKTIILWDSCFIIKH